MGQSNFDVVTANAFIGSQFLTQGNTFFVKPATGGDGNDGKSPKRAFKTLPEAYDHLVAGQNDVVYLMAESDSAGGTTDYQGATLNWNKDLCHLIGVNSGPRMSQRSRVAFTSTYAGASNLFTLSANGCLIQGVEFYAGVASVNPTGCMLVTGERNHVRKCHIAGMGNTANDIAGAYSVQLSGTGAGAIQAAVLEVKLRYVDQGNQQRRDRAARYDELFRAAGLAAASASASTDRKSVV